MSYPVEEIAFRTQVRLHWRSKVGAARLSKQGDLTAMARTLIGVGILLVVLGLLWPWLGRIGLGRLPGDILIERENFTFYAPIGSGLLISLVLSLFLWLLNR
jgi:Protein of unknown function (DUF2905)